jgi:hypothetical protein
MGNNENITTYYSFPQLGDVFYLVLPAVQRLEHWQVPAQYEGQQVTGCGTGGQV